MDHNRRGLAIMLAALLISILVASVRSCDDKAAGRYDQEQAARQALIAKAPQLTNPIRDYRIVSIEEGCMTVEAGPSLTPDELQILAGKLTRALHDSISSSLGSDLVLVDINRGGKRVCHAQTSAQGVYVKLDE